MRFVLAVVLALHGLIHTLGFVQGLGLARVAQLPPIGPRVAPLWLAVALLLLTAAALLAFDTRAWWMPALAGVVLSQALIFSAWSEAKFGTVANVVVLVPLLLVLLDFRASSLRSAYGRDVRAGLAQAQPAPVVTEGDLAPLPEPVRTYLRRAGVVGKPRVRNFHAEFSAEMRSARDAPWMKARADQHEFFRPAARLFFMKAARAGVPFDVFHRYAGDRATMQVRVAGLVPVTDAGGRELTQSETVTLLNDMCLLAPATLVDAPIAWETIDARTVRATFTNAGHRVSAVLTFDASGDLAEFRSEDRYRTDGKSLERLPWFTPVSDYEDFGGVRLARRGEARWRDTGGAEWAYGRFVLDRIAYNVAAPPAFGPAVTGSLP